MRKDALRNQERIMVAARELIAEHGAGASMERIAGQAGVAVGTLYRHHPTKADLVAAVIEDSVEHMAELAETAAAAIARGEDCDAAFRQLLHGIAAGGSSNRAVRTAALSLGVSTTLHPEDTVPAPGSGLARLFTALDEVIAQARAAGLVRRDTVRGDLSVLLGGIFEAQLDEASRDRYVDIVAAGLRPPPT